MQRRPIIERPQLGRGWKLPRIAGVPVSGAFTAWPHGVGPGPAVPKGGDLRLAAPPMASAITVVEDVSLSS